MEDAKCEHQAKVLREKLKEMDDRRVKMEQMQSGRMEDERRREEERMRHEQMLRQVCPSKHTHID